MKLKSDKKLMLPVMVGALVWFALGYLVFAGDAYAHEPKQAGRAIEHTHAPTWGAGIGLGLSDSTGSLAFDISMLRYRLKLFASLWTTNNDGGREFVTQPPRDGSKEPATLIVSGQHGDTSNGAFGAAYFREYQNLSGGVGVAFVANDDTLTIREHGQVYVEGNIDTPKSWRWLISRCGVKFYTRFAGDGETFITCERRN